MIPKVATEPNRAAKRPDQTRHPCLPLLQIPWAGHSTRLLRPLCSQAVVMSVSNLFTAVRRLTAVSGFLFVVILMLLVSTASAVSTMH